MFLIENSISSLKNFLRRNFIWFYPLSSVLLFSIIFYLNSDSINKNINHELLITVLSTLAGFLLTLLGILFSFRDKPFILVLLEVQIWDKVELSVFLGLMSGLLGIFFSFINTLLSNPNIVLVFLEVILFVVTITYLVIIGVWIKICWKYIK